MGDRATDVEVRDNQGKSRFEVRVEGLLAVCEYHLGHDSITFTHTIVPGALEGRGIASALARGALNAARERDLRVVPECTFIQAFIARHPEYADLLGTGADTASLPGEPDR